LSDDSSQHTATGDRRRLLWARRSISDKIPGRRYLHRQGLFPTLGHVWHVMFHSKFRRRCLRPLAAIMLMVGFGAPGCVLHDLHGPGFGTPDATWGRQWRTTSQAVKPMGLDTRAREIERSLGIP
jgi:hypothetical protein